MNHDVHLTDEVEDLLLKEELKAKNGPGIMKIKHIFPCELEASIEVLKTSESIMPSRHLALKQCWFQVGPLSQTLN